MAEIKILSFNWNTWFYAVPTVGLHVRALFGNVTVAQMVKILPKFYGHHNFIITLTRARHWSLSWARWIQSTPSYLVSL